MDYDTFSKGIYTLPNFDIKTEQPLSRLFVERNLLTFQQAALFVRQLPYGRNTSKNDLSSLFSDNCGTCSTKHALLKQLAHEMDGKTYSY